MVEDNSSVGRYLDFYISESYKINHAVLIRGKWGSGKTFYVKKLVEDWKEQKKVKCIFISLNGLSKVNEIQDAIYAALHPILSSNGMRIGMAILKNSLKASIKLDLNHDKTEINATVPDINLKKFFEDPGEALLVFDDLERCRIPLAEVLGYINGFVESEKTKVIIIANEEEIKDENYAKIKEKVVGQTLAISAPTAAALKTFIGEIPEEKLRRFFSAAVGEIESVYKESKTNNLRLLRQSLWDYRTLSSGFKDSYWKSRQSVLQILFLTIALSLEVRSGELSEQRFSPFLTGRNMRLFRTPGDNIKEEDAIYNKYPMVKFDQSYVSIACLERLFFEGAINAQEIQETMDSHPALKSPEELASWRLAWNGYDLEDDVYEKAVIDVEKKFNERFFKKEGEILHVLGLRVEFAQISVIDKRLDQVVQEGIQYINSLAEANELPQPDEDRLFGHVSGAYGLGFREGNSAAFKEQHAHLQAKQAQALQASLPKKAAELMHKLGDPDAFYRALNINNYENSPFWDVPLMQHVDAREFVEKTMSLKVAQIRGVFVALRGRYDDHRLEHKLKEEAAWLRLVKEGFARHADTSKPLTKTRIEAMLRWLPAAAEEGSTQEGEAL